MSSHAHMEHDTSRQLYAYWDRIRGGRFAPWRADIDPADIHRLLPDVFLGEVRSATNYRFRLAGTRLCAIYRRELKGRDMLERWSKADQEGFQTLLHSACVDGTASVVRFQGHTETGHATRFEMITLPLRHHDGHVSRLLGAVSPFEHPYWLGSHPIECHTLEDLDVIWPDNPPHFMKRAANQDIDAPMALTPGLSRRHRHLTVFDGGRSD